VPVSRVSLAIATALLLACFLPGCSTDFRSRNGIAVKDNRYRQAAPDFTLKDADGRTVHLSDYKGKVVLLDFWATSCGPCRIEIPWFTDLERKKKDRGFEVLGVAVNEDGWDDVKPFLARMKVNYRVVMGDDRTTQSYGGIDAIPTTLLIDKQGKIAAIHIGLASPKEFEDRVEELLREG
jgi:peroxiredoxin